MRTKVTLALVFLNAVLFFFIFKFERKWRTDGDVLEARRRVLGPETADIRSLEITSAVPGGSFTLARRGDTWWLTKPLEWPANEFAVSALLRDLQFLEHESSFKAQDLAKSGQSLANYGLDKSKLKIEFRSGPNADAPPLRLELGDTTKVGNRLYIFTPGDDRIHVVSRAFAESFMRPAAQLRSDALLTIPVFEARSLSIRAATSAATVRVVHRTSTRWEFETPILAPASKLEVDNVLQDLNALHAVNFNPANAPATLPSAAPDLRLTIEGNNRRETLLLGEAIGSTAIPTGTATAPDVERYAQLEGRTALFTVAVPARLLEKLRNAQEKLREKRILPEFNRNTVTAVTLTAPNQPPLMLQRDPQAPADSPWQVVRRVDGTASAPLPVDAAALKRLLDQLGTLAAKDLKGFVSDAPSAADLENWGFNRPERVVALTLTGNTPPIELQLGTDAQQEVYARLGPAGASIYAVPTDVLRELPVAPRAWRDRLVRALPPTAKITALKLTDLESNATLLDLALDADGKPKPDTADAAAVATVLAQLRSLRAQRFVQDTFTDRVTFAGEERAWRYRLDATVSLPGGAAGEQTTVSSLLLSVRGGGAQQLAGAKDAGAVFEIEQPFLDALWKLTPAGQRDPGVPKTP